MKKINLILVLWFFCVLGTSYAQEKPSYHVKYSQAEKTIDGIISPGEWPEHTTINDFWLWYPVDTERAAHQTEIYISYDEKNLYVMAKCYAAGNDYTAPSLRRDFRAGFSDNINILIDPFNDGQNAMLFGLTPTGVNREALIANGGVSLRGFQTAWDNKWVGDAHMSDSLWTAEFAIPFSTLRYKKGAKKWGFNCYRFDVQGNERSTWIHVPQNQFVFNLAYMGELIWDKPLSKSSSNISVIPYVSAGRTIDKETNPTSTTNDFGAGLDAKFAVTSSLNLDLTVNPDFSQVEVDRQVTNLTRFEISLPERRQFFLENADLFGNFAQDRINPFFSRRIGIAKDEVNSTVIENPIWAGARLSGKLNDRTRIGLLNTVSSNLEDINRPASNQSVLSLQLKTNQRSNLAAIVVNNTPLANDTALETPIQNTVTGLEYNLGTNDNKWNGKAYYLQSFGETSTADSRATGIFINRNDPAYIIGIGSDWVDEDFHADLGFVPRKNYYNLYSKTDFFFYPQNSTLSSHGPVLDTRQNWQPGFGLADRKVFLGYQFRFVNNMSTEFGYEYNFIHLFNSFDPSRRDQVALPANSDYHNSAFTFRMRTNQANTFSFSGMGYLGQFFNGNRYGVSGQVIYQLPPYGNISMNVNVNRIKLPKPYADETVYLVGPRLDWTFTKSLFLTAFVQYNNQTENFNVNTRLQWRFKPVSDMYLVYTDNYNTDGFTNKNKAIIFKMTYWLNM